MHVFLGCQSFLLSGEKDGEVTDAAGFVLMPRDLTVHFSHNLLGFPATSECDIIPFHTASSLALLKTHTHPIL